MNLLWIRAVGPLLGGALSWIVGTAAMAEAQLLVPFDRELAPFIFATEDAASSGTISHDAEHLRQGSGAALLVYGENVKWFFGSQRFNDGPPGSLFERIFGKDEPIPDGIDLSSMRGLVVSLRSDRSMLLHLSMTERDGSRYRVLIDLSPKQWRHLELPLDSFVLDDGTRDENDLLDPEQVHLIAFSDFETQVFGKSAANRLLVDGFGITSERPWDGSEFVESGKVRVRGARGRIVHLGEALDLELVGGTGSKVRGAAVTWTADGAVSAVSSEDARVVDLDSGPGPLGQWKGALQAPEIPGRYLARVELTGEAGELLAVGESILAVLPPVARTDWFGTCAISSFESVTDPGADFTVADAVGLGWDRPIVYWDRIQPSDDEWDWEVLDALVAERVERGIRLSPVIALAQGPAVHEAPDDFDAFERFAEGLAARYRGRVDHWVVSNEPNGREQWMEPALQVKILASFARGARRGNADVKIVLAGMQCLDLEYVEALYAAGAAPHFDIMNVHPYAFPGPPEAEGGSRFLGLTLGLPASFERLRELRPLMERHGDGLKPIWLGEVSWGAGVSAMDLEAKFRDFQSTPLDQARYLVRSALLSRAWNIDKYGWLMLVDLPDEPSLNWARTGLADARGVPRPSLVAAVMLVHEIESAEVVGEIPGLPAGARGVRFRTAEGGRLDALWALEPVTVGIQPGPRDSVTLARMLGGQPRSFAAGEPVPLVLDASPVYVRSTSAEVVAVTTQGH